MREVSPWWLRFEMVRGYDEGEESESEGSEGEQEEDKPEEQEEKPEDKADGLSKALKAERLRAKNLERELKALKEGQEKTKKTEGDDDKGKKPESDRALSQKLEKLSAAYRSTSLRSTVQELAKDFRDPSDVMAYLNESELDYEQDDDDPSNVVWDEAAIKAVVKDLAKNKPYLLKAAEGDQSGGKKTPTRPSGSKFAGSGAGKTTSAQQLNTLATRIPALRGAVPRGGNNK